VTAHELRYAVPGRPVSWQRSAVVNGRTLTPHANRIAKDAHRYAAIAAGARVQSCDAQGAYELHVVAYYDNRVQGDADRLLGLPMDALEGLVYRSDRQVQRVSCERRIDRENPRLEVVCRRIEEP
jgi:hypothetical protein